MIQEPPKDVEPSRLYYLLTDSQVVQDNASRHCLGKCIETLRVMEENKTLEVATKGAYFDWFVHDRKLVCFCMAIQWFRITYIVFCPVGFMATDVMCHVLHQIEQEKAEHLRISEIVTSAIGHWRDWKKRDNFFGRCEEISKLKDYLDFNAAIEQYKDALRKADLDFQHRRDAYVRKALKLYNNANLMKEEEAT